MPNQACAILIKNLFRVKNEDTPTNTGTFDDNMPPDTGTFNDDKMGRYNLFPDQEEDNDTPADNDATLTGAFDNVNDSTQTKAIWLKNQIMTRTMHTGYMNIPPYLVHTMILVPYATVKYMIDMGPHIGSVLLKKPYE